MKVCVLCGNSGEGVRDRMLTGIKAMNHCQDREACRLRVLTVEECENIIDIRNGEYDDQSRARRILVAAIDRITAPYAPHDVAASEAKRREDVYQRVCQMVDEANRRADGLANELREVIALLRREVESRYTLNEVAKAIPQAVVDYLLHHGHLERHHGSLVWLKP